MWICQVCAAEVDDHTWEVCWKCSTPKGATAVQVEKMRERINAAKSCLRCEGVMHYKGTKRFREVDRALGGIETLFDPNDAYDVYFCGDCGKVEFYVDGIGDEDRGEWPDL